MDAVQTGAIAEKYLDRLYRMAVAYCKNEQDACDAVQNTFLKLMQCKREFTDEEHIFKQLAKVTVNECRGIWRTMRIHNMVSLDAVYEENENNPALVSDDSIAFESEVFDAVMKLPSKYSIVIHLYYYEDRNVNEIAEILGITPSNVQIRLMRARNKLKEQIKETIND